MAGNTSRNGTAFAAWSFATATRSSCSRNPAASLTRYFPELVEAVRALRAKRFVLDAEIVVPQGGAFSFDALLQRIHPAPSRVRRLSQETPARLIVFDLLAGANGQSLVDEPLRERRRKLEAFAAPLSRQRLHPIVAGDDQAQRGKGWLKRVGATLDGIIAKRLDLDYRSGERTGMQKIKNFRSADCVVGGFRYNEGKEGRLAAARTLR